MSMPSSSDEEHPLFPGERAVVRPDQLLTGQLVELQRQAFGEATRVDEHDRRAMGADQLEDARMNRRPDGAALFRAGC
jgi:hypothetical protein